MEHGKSTQINSYQQNGRDFSNMEKSWCFIRSGAFKRQRGKLCFCCVQCPSGRNKPRRSKLPALISVPQLTQTNGDIKYEVNGAPFDHVLTNGISDPTDEAGLERRAEVSQLCSTEV